MAKKIVLGILLLGMTGVASAADPLVYDACTDLKGLDKYLDKLPVCQKVIAAETKAVAAPEMDPATAIAGLTLLLGGTAVIRGRRSRIAKDRDPA